MAAVCASSFVYHSYSSLARVSADSGVPRIRCFSASYGSFSKLSDRPILQSDGEGDTSPYLQHKPIQQHDVALDLLAQ